LLFGASLKVRYLHTEVAVWGPLTLQLLLGAPVKAEYFHTTLS